MKKQVIPFAHPPKTEGRLLEDEQKVSIIAKHITPEPIEYQGPNV
ncbi:MAG: hypothetical protein ACOX2W_02775 [Desulfomonilia bacterium]|jgi:hypothetical protein|nr:hypothetical protein [Desulfomonilia bacterium]